MRALLEELRPERLFPSLTVGIIAGIGEVILAISLAALLFSGPLAHQVPAGIGLALFSTAVVGLVIALTSSLPGMIAAAQDSPAAIMAVVIAAIVGGRAHASAEEVASTAMAAIGLTALLTGGVLFVLGICHLGGLVRYVPYPVIGGFLAGTGWLLSRGALTVMTDVPLTGSSLATYVAPRVLAQWVPGVIYAGILLVVLRRVSHALIMPAMLLGGTGLFYAALAASGTTLAQATERGWLLPALPAGGLWKPLDLTELGRVQWPAITAHLDLLAVVVLVSMLALLLNLSAVELAVERDVDLNRELRAAGIANVLAGLGGGLVGFQTLGMSVLAHRMSARGRLPGIVMAVVCVGALFLGPSLLGLIPKPVLAGLLLCLGLSFLAEWVYDAWFRMPKSDYGIVLLILAIIIAVGVLEGVAVGALVAVVLFVVKYSRVDVVRHALSGAEQQSRVDRPVEHRRLLRERGAALYVCKLQGFIFFGTSNRLLEQVRRRIDDGREPPLRYAVLDFNRVSGLDSSAVFSFAKMKQVAAAQDITLIFTRLLPSIRRQLGEGGVLEAPETRLRTFADLDHGLEWCETEVLAAEGARLIEDYHPLAEQIAPAMQTPETATRLMAYLERVDLGAGDCLVRQGEGSADMYFIESGQLTVQIEGHGEPAIRIGTRRAGTIVGELGLYLHAPRTASLIADRPCTVYRLSGPALTRMEREEPDVAHAFHRFMVLLLAERLADTTRAIEILRD